MWRVTIKGLLAHKLRLALTALAIVLGVTFICRDLRADRHAAQHVRHAVREHLPEHRLPGARRGPVRQRRHGDAQPRPRVGARHRAAGPGRRGRRRLGDRLRPVHRPRRQGHLDRRRAEPRPLLRPQRADLRAAPGPGQGPDDAARGGDGPRHGAEVRLQGRAAGADPVAGADPDVHHRRPGALRDGRQPGRGDPGRLRHRRPPRSSWARWASSTPSTSSPQPGADKATGAARHRPGAAPRGRGGDRPDRGRTRRRAPSARPWASSTPPCSSSPSSRSSWAASPS